MFLEDAIETLITYFDHKVMIESAAEPLMPGVHNQWQWWSWRTKTFKPVPYSFEFDIIWYFEQHTVQSPQQIQSAPIKALDLRKHILNVALAGYAKFVDV